jgi:hypothetical protein
MDRAARREVAFENRLLVGRRADDSARYFGDGLGMLLVTNHNWEA